MSKYTKAIAGFVGFATAVTMSFGTASAATTADLQAQITALLAQISSLQSQLGTTQTPVGTTAGYTFTKDLTVGSKGTDVTNLQSSLNAKLDKSGGSMAGAFVAYAHGTATNFEVVNVSYGTGSTPPSGPSEGCIYIQYT